MERLVAGLGVAKDNEEEEEEDSDTEEEGTIADDEWCLMFVGL